MLRFIISLIWLVVVVGVDILAFVCYPPIVGAGIELAIALITFLVPYLRKKDTMTRWWGWLALYSAIGLAATHFGIG